jgi:ABC-type glycerol-3-phosphate transport system substrate-binding protein
MRYFRSSSAVHQQRIYGVPMSGYNLLLYYRPSLQKRYGISPPATWYVPL